MKKAMIFAAGLGTRLRPITAEIPKALVKVDDIPLLEYAIRHCKVHGYKNIIINVHHHTDLIKDFLKKKNNFKINIEISDESNELLETGGGLKKAEWFFNDCKNFLVYNVDILTDLNLSYLLEYHNVNNAIATLAVRNRKTSRYLLFDEGNRMCGWKNMTTNETKLRVMPIAKLKSIAFSGVQVLSSNVFNYLDAYPAKFSITDFYIDICHKEKILAYAHDSSFWMDIGKIEMLNKADSILSKYNFLYQFD